MPAKTTIFNIRAQATKSFPLGPRNTIIFSPQARFVLVAGFGNLAGQMDIYDLEKDFQKLCTIEASNASVCEWSPDGQHILTATTSPRLRVDNGVRIWHVGGRLMYNEDLQELYQVVWKPQALTHPPNADPLEPAPQPHPSALTLLGTVKTPSKPAGAYRPPGARGQVTPLAFKREDQGGEAFISNGSLSQGFGTNSFGKPRKREVLGAEPVQDGDGTTAITENDADLSKAALKNKKKREAKKAKDAAGKAGGLAPTGEDRPTSISPAVSRSPERRDRNSHSRNRSKGAPGTKPGSRQERTSPGLGNPPLTQNQGQDQATLQRPPNKVEQIAAPEVMVSSPANGNAPHDKKIRALLKKLRAIDDLRMRRAGGEKLEGTQIRKMDTEDDVRKELQALGWSE